MKLNLSLLETNAQIFDSIMSGMRDVLDNAIRKSIPRISNEIKQIMTDALMSEPEYASLISGKLKADFGIRDSSMVNQIVSQLSDTITVSSKPVSIKSNGLTGGLTLQMIPSTDFGGIIYQNIAQTQDDKGYSLPWLEWLLLQSNNTIIKNYEVKYGSSPYSRSGMALMVESNSDWRVPPEFAGSQNNNWTTRAIEKLESPIYALIKNTIESNIQ